MVVPISKSLWKDKPMFLEQGHIISQEVFETNSSAGIYPGLIGELYWNFNIFGIILGFLFLGFFTKKIYQIAILKRDSPFAIAVYSIFWSHLLFFVFSHSLGMGLLKFFLIVIPFSIVCLIFSQINTSE